MKHHHKEHPKIKVVPFCLPSAESWAFHGPFTESIGLACCAKDTFRIEDKCIKNETAMSQCLYSSGLAMLEIRCTILTLYKGYCSDGEKK